MKLHQLLYHKSNLDNYVSEHGITKKASVLLEDFRKHFGETYRLVDTITCGEDEVSTEIVDRFRPLYDLFREAHKIRTGIELGELE